MSKISSSLKVVGTALGNRRIRAVVIAFAFFSAAEWVRWVGLLVYGFDRSGPAGSSLISVIQLVPAALITPFTSSLADRYPRVRVLTVAYLLGGSGTFGAGLAIAAHGPFIVVALLAAAGLCGVSMVRPTQASLLPELAATPEELTAANVVSSFLMSASLFVGPVIASVVLALWGPMEVVVLGGFMLLVGGGCVAVVRPASGSAGPRRERVHLLGGFHELGRNEGARAIVELVTLHAAVWGMVEILIVTLAIRALGLGQSSVGLFSGALGIGAVLGGGATVMLVGRARLTPALVVGVSLWSAPLLFVGVVDAPPLVAALLVMAGMGISFMVVWAHTLLQRTVPDESLGRVFGLLESGYVGAWAVGSAAAPLMLALLGLGAAFAIAAVSVPLAAGLWWRRLVAADRHADVPGPELELLRSVTMFHPLSEAVVERLARNARQVSVAAGSLVIREGDPGDLFYVIADGEVSITIAGAEVARYGPGHYFGEIALLRDVPRQASVTALTDVRLITLERAHFLDAMTGSSSATAIAHEEIGRRLKADEEHP